MKRPFGLSAAVMLGLAASVWGAGLPCWKCGLRCVVPPSSPCSDCSCPCDRGLHHCSPWKSEHAQKLIGQLSGEDCCQRIKAARQLGCRLHADYCCDPMVLDALIRALQSDACWEVRREAAWSIMMQKARVEQGVLALYLASKLDPHFLVRFKANEALDILLVCRRDCFKELFAAADELIKQLRGKYRPGTHDCAILLSQGCGTLPSAVLPPVVPK